MNPRITQVTQIGRSGEEIAAFAYPLVEEQMAITQYALSFRDKATMNNRARQATEARLKMNNSSGSYL